jgi:hypothetical protein
VALHHLRNGSVNKGMGHWECAGPLRPAGRRALLSRVRRSRKSTRSRILLQKEPARPRQSRQRPDSDHDLESGFPATPMQSATRRRAASRQHPQKGASRRHWPTICGPLDLGTVTDDIRPPICSPWHSAWRLMTQNGDLKSNAAVGGIYKSERGGGLSLSIAASSPRLCRFACWQRRRRRGLR